ncbi:vitelline membrane outer layer protein 1-like isoform X2 [Sinocyclocheilus rhinocerous]|uniref:Vitelline membrane outer layer protein 1-like n=1 Tax=Sinocyclocheilus rhinocerous TaxID=307959 RepID=A0A673HGR9_9TELE|nr:PREDICTED: vitelline membrane outer layer protein 1-like isoform X2 [Sinocyclocheilus rhinocerous]
MHQFISMLFSLLVITGLQVSESTGTRSERSIDRSYRSELTVPNGGRWGSWGPREMCPTGTYAVGFSLKVEYRTLGDDTALNGIRLFCIDASKVSNSIRDYASVQSSVGRWGVWTVIKWCRPGLLTAFKLKVERPQGDGDDTAANNVLVQCSHGPSLVGEGTSWGEWDYWSNTCEGKGICGIQTRVEESQGGGDDTALNDVRMYCCD